MLQAFDRCLDFFLFDRIANESDVRLRHRNRSRLFGRHREFSIARAHGPDDDLPAFRPDIKGLVGLELLDKVPLYRHRVGVVGPEDERLRVR